MTTTKTQTTEYRLEASARKADREREAVQAMKEYEAEKIRVDANTARLRALRLAKEIAEAQAAANKALRLLKVKYKEPRSTSRC